MTDSKNVPTAEEFERASRLSEERARELDRVRDRVLSRFRGRLQEFFILDQRDVDFRAYVFFKRNGDVALARATGLDQQISEFVYDALEAAGRGLSANIKVAFEFDSDENVQTHFAGNYGLRLRG